MPNQSKMIGSWSFLSRLCRLSDLQVNRPLISASLTSQSSMPKMLVCFPGLEMRISKVYTRTGDGGETTLVNGQRVSKASLRVDAYGDVDELNSVIGVVRSLLIDKEIDEVLSFIQNELFTLGADLASPSDIEVPRINDEFIKSLEKYSDQYIKEIKPLKEFILPGGSETGAMLHLARTVARRAERKVVAL